MRPWRRISMTKFLSTPSARRATSCKSMWCRAGAISIHALREEGDTEDNGTSGDFEIFLSTPSARRATGAGPAADRRRFISIHALREEGDRRTMAPAAILR